MLVKKKNMLLSAYYTPGTILRALCELSDVIWVTL